MGLIQTSGKKRADGVTGGASAVTWAMPSNFTAGNDAVLCVGLYDSVSGRITGVTLGGTAAVRAVRITAGTLSGDIWYAESMAGGTPNIVISTDSGTGQYLSGSCEEWDNLASTSLDQTGTGTGSSSSPSVTASGATTQADEVVYAMLISTDGINWTNTTPPSGYTETYDEPDNSSFMGGSGAYKVLSATETPTATFTTGSSIAWSSALATFKLSSGAATLDQYGFRWRLDDGSETTATWAAAQNAAP